MNPSPSGTVSCLFKIDYYLFLQFFDISATFIIDDSQTLLSSDSSWGSVPFKYSSQPTWMYYSHLELRLFRNLAVLGFPVVSFSESRSIYS